MQTFLNVFLKKNAVRGHNFLIYVYNALKMEKFAVFKSFLRFVQHHYTFRPTKCKIPFYKQKGGTEKSIRAFL